MTSPAERYAASRKRNRHPDLIEFEQSLAFPLDQFQREGCAAVAEGRSVLVAAPTGAGKTVVGEYAIRHAHAQGLKAFYTTPIKALSNQKFHDLRAAYGESAVGLLTGDTSINPEADIVVMTTEVVRNMIYSGSHTLDRLGVVVLDEVHYLADRFRGSVWEEVIIHLDQMTSIVALSATVSNAEEFGAWLSEVRGDTRVIVSEHRPVPLWPHVLIREGMFDLYAPTVNAQEPGPNPRINPEVEAILRRHAHHEGPRGKHVVGGRHGRARRSPPRFAVVDQLDRQGLLPAIVFVFSRAGCEDAVDQVRASGLALTTDEEREEIAAIIEERCAGVPSEDLGALGYLHWRDHLEAGIAAHHAGMIPLFKEVVEELFRKGLIKVVYATETLALGINMPARSVVLEKLVKWDGQGHKDLTAGEYTQLTGRAGRRGIDVEGHAVVVEHPGLDVSQLGRLASRRTYPLMSSFQPTYNMTVNLVHSVGAERAREVLEMSFAQFQADQGVVGKARRAQELERTLEGYRDAVSCDRGDFMEYARLRHDLNRLQKGQSKAASRKRREATAETLAGLRRGDVVKVGGGRRAGVAAVVVPDDRADAPRPVVVTDEGRQFRLAVAELHHGIDVVGTVKIPKRFDHRNARQRRELAQVIEEAKPTFDLPSRRKHGAAPHTPDAEMTRLRQRMQGHPCHACPDREDHARWAERYFRTLRDKDRVVGEIQRATGSIARVFDRRCDVLGELGYLVREGEAWTVSESGEMMRTLYSENDLVIAECLRTGVWNDLQAPALAAAVSTLIYNGRRDDEMRPPRIPGGQHGALGRALQETVRVWSRVSDLQEAHRLGELPAPEWGIVSPIHGWAQGRSLDTVLSGSEIAPGDMVRWTKQVIDGLDQIADVAPTETVRNRARTAIAAMRRGVVAY
ncbi:DEAD/DEAH box helicase [Demequina zhanjiangensis]|uniref:DEAD/DEAH box helicase n=1 Tax=Demequina zhanjiangensis TaxID=3051659 RepID=A0ABT8G2J0_9MICO|nr:DEAD/DEAH box helicase [Demequina sp. SYSU T00b26]MDN4473313.1 DEAD/DEAH box helicase [Demequina sp. SYSU T00b26]